MQYITTLPNNQLKSQLYQHVFRYLPLVDLHSWSSVDRPKFECCYVSLIRQFIRIAYASLKLRKLHIRLMDSETSEHLVERAIEEEFPYTNRIAMLKIPLQELTLASDNLFLLKWFDAPFLRLVVSRSQNPSGIEMIRGRSTVIIKHCASILVNMRLFALLTCSTFQCSIRLDNRNRRKWCEQIAYLIKKWRANELDIINYWFFTSLHNVDQATFFEMFTEVGRIVGNCTFDGPGELDGEIVSVVFATRNDNTETLAAVWKENKNERGEDIFSIYLKIFNPK